MATFQITGKERGERIAEQDVERINGSSFFVKSQLDKVGYSVTDFNDVCHATIQTIDTGESSVNTSAQFKNRKIANFLPENCIEDRFKRDLWEVP